jgi:hypothetical protein
MRKAVEGAEPLRAVGTSLSGPQFDKCHMRTRHGHSDTAANAPEWGFCQEMLLQGQKADNLFHCFQI